MTAARREQSAASHAALTQRLKKFGFTNYAAPSPAPLPSAPRDEQEAPSPEISTANTSADSTPLLTPTQEDGSRFHFDGRPGHDVNANVLVHDDEPGRDGEEERRLSWGLSGSLQMQDGHPATIIPPMPSFTVTSDKGVKHDLEDPAPTPVATASSNPMEISKDRGRATDEHEPSALSPTPAHILTPPTLSPNGLGVEMGTSPPFSMLAGMELRNGMFASKESSGPHWLWGGESTQERRETTPTQPNVVAPTPQHVTTPAHIRTSPPIPASSNPLMPPQRKKSQVPTFSIGRTSSSSSRSGSGSSGSDTASGDQPSTKKGSSNVPSRPKLVSPQPWPLPPQRWVKSPPPSLGSRRIFEDNDATFPVNPLAQNLPPNLSELQSPSPSDDAVYQAFVRQWCFAQGPAPNLSAGSSPGKSERMSPLSPDVVVR